jgi:hypothetical protein
VFLASLAGTPLLGNIAVIRLSPFGFQLAYPLAKQLQFLQNKRHIQGVVYAPPTSRCMSDGLRKDLNSFLRDHPIGPLPGIDPGEIVDLYGIKDRARVEIF